MLACTLPGAFAGFCAMPGAVRLEAEQGGVIRSIAAVAAGGALGSVVRYLMGVWFARAAGTAFPWGTLAVNLSGCIAIGIVAELAQRRLGLDPTLRLFLVTGLLGGYTTFSAFSYEALTLGESGSPSRAIVYVLLSVAGGIAAAYAGALAVRALVA